MLKLIRASLIFSLISAKAFASYPEMFGAGFTTSSIGNQANMDINDPSNNYYVPALMGFSDKFNVYIGSTSTAVYFENIGTITTKNSTNSPTNEPGVTGTVDVNYPKFYGSAIHLAIPVGGTEHLGSISLSAFMPTGDIIQANSGHPFLPEYVMYRSRHQKTSAYLNYAKNINDNWAFSIGTILGFQASALVKTYMSLNDNSLGSWVTSQAEASPSLGVISSVVKMNNKSFYYLTYQQEMKSNLKAQMSGEMTNPVGGLFNLSMDQMMFYDPHTIRFGSARKIGDVEIFGAVEYQIWSNYKVPKMLIKKNSGIVGSSKDFERLALRDTINPRIGLKFNWTDNFLTSIGTQYRMTPLKGDFSGSGNSIDADAFVFSTGAEYGFVVFSKDVKLGGSFQYHSLKKKNVVKSPGQENGNLGDKIGSPGYQIGGHVIAGSIGLKFNF